MTNVFVSIGKFSNYVALDEIKWLCAFTKHTTQRFIIKPQSMSIIGSLSPFDIKYKKLNLGEKPQEINFEDI